MATVEELTWNLKRLIREKYTREALLLSDFEAEYKKYFLFKLDEPSKYQPGCHDWTTLFRRNAILKESFKIQRINSKVFIKATPATDSSLKTFFRLVNYTHYLFQKARDEANAVDEDDSEEYEDEDEETTVKEEDVPIPNDIVETISNGAIPDLSTNQDTNIAHSLPLNGDADASHNERRPIFLGFRSCDELGLGQLEEGNLGNQVLTAQGEKGVEPVEQDDTREVAADNASVIKSITAIDEPESVGNVLSTLTAITVQVEPDSAVQNEFSTVSTGPVTAESEAAAENVLDTAIASTVTVKVEWESAVQNELNIACTSTVKEEQEVAADDFLGTVPVKDELESDTRSEFELNTATTGTGMDGPEFGSQNEFDDFTAGPSHAVYQRKIELSAKRTLSMSLSDSTETKKGRANILSSEEYNVLVKDIAAIVSLAEQEQPLTFDTLETNMNNPTNWIVLPIIDSNDTKSGNPLRGFFRWDTEHKFHKLSITNSGQATWRNTKYRDLGIPNETIIFGEMADYDDENQEGKTVFGIIDCAILGGVDMTKLPFEERWNNCAQYLTEKATNNQLPANLEILMKPYVILPRIEEVFSAIQMNPNSNSQSLSYLFSYQDQTEGNQHKVPIRGLIFLKIKHTDTDGEEGVRPATFLECMNNRWRWPFDSDSCFAVENLFSDQDDCELGRWTFILLMKNYYTYLAPSGSNHNSP